MKRNLSRQLRLAVLMLFFLLGVAIAKPDTAYASSLTGVSNLRQTEGTQSSFKVEWDKDVSAGGYEFQYSLDGTNWSTFEHTYDGDTWNGGTYTGDLYLEQGNLSAGSQYYVRMRSFDKYRYWAYKGPTSDANLSDWSATLEVVTAPAHVTNLKQTNGDSSSITVSWDKSTGATSYQVYYIDGNSEFLAGEVTGTTCKVTGLDPDKEYKIRVYAVKESASGYKAKDGYTEHACCTTAGKVKNLELNKWDTDSNTVTIVWDDNEDKNTGYEVNVANLSGKVLKNYKVDTNSAEFSIKSIKNKGCIVKVRAYRDIDGVEIYGKWSSAKTIVAQPSLVLIKKSSKSIKLSWKKISGATSYTVYRSTSSYAGFKKIKTTKSTSLTNSGLKSGTIYYYYVVANGVKVKGKSQKTTAAKYREVAYTTGAGSYYTYEKIK